MTETVTVTVLFTDVVGSVSMRQHQGEAAAHEIMTTHNDLVRQQISQCAGREIKTIGDSFMVGFDSARKAVDCAIGIQRALLAYNHRNAVRPVKVRIGLHTGEAILVGDDLFGSSVDAAARIMARAEGDQILVSDVVKTMLGAAKDVVFCGQTRVRLKGFPDRWRLWEVAWRPDPVPIPTATDANTARAVGIEPPFGTGRTPYIGRAEERSLLRQAVDRAVAGAGGVALIAGEAGLGKTRLVDEIAAEARACGMFVVRGQCYVSVAGHPHSDDYPICDPV